MLRVKLFHCILVPYIFLFVSIQTGEKLKEVKPHGDKINDLQKSTDEMMFITASKDNYSRLFDTETMQTLKEYKTERPVNSASMSPIRDQVDYPLY